MATLKRIAIDYQALALFCVDYTDKFSNFFEDLLKLDRFAESVEGHRGDANAHSILFNI